MISKPRTHHKSCSSNPNLVGVDFSGWILIFVCWNPFQNSPCNGPQCRLTRSSMDRDSTPMDLPPFGCHLYCRCYRHSRHCHHQHHWSPHHQNCQHPTIIRTTKPWTHHRWPPAQMLLLAAPHHQNCSSYVPPMKPPFMQGLFHHLQPSTRVFLCGRGLPSSLSTSSLTRVHSSKLCGPSSYPCDACLAID